MRRLITTLVLGLCLLGCDEAAPAVEPVQLLTGVNGCYAGGESGRGGLLLGDPEFGTRFDGNPVMWPQGFTGALVGGEIQVLDAEGNVVAKTGSRYFISVAPIAEERRALMEAIGAYPAAANCGYPWDLVDCGSPATGSPGLAEAERSCQGQ